MQTLRCLLQSFVGLYQPLGMDHFYRRHLHEKFAIILLNENYSKARGNNRPVMFTQEDNTKKSDKVRKPAALFYYCLKSEIFLMLFLIAFFD